MNAHVMCLLAVLAADPTRYEEGSVYTLSDNVVPVIADADGQSGGQDEFLPATRTDRLSQSPVYQPPFGGGNPLWGPSYCYPFRYKLFGEFLYLSARDVNLPYATTVDAVSAAPVPFGDVAVADPDSDPGFRVGGAMKLTPWSSLTASFWHFENETTDGISLPDGSSVVLRPDLVHPNTLLSVGPRLQSRARYDIEFQIVDLDYTAPIWTGAGYAVNYSLGVRYAGLDQDFEAVYSNLGRTTVETAIDFDGIGPRIALDGERFFRTGFLVYGRGAASFLLGEFDSNYRQVDIFAGPQARVAFEEDRIVPVLDLEVGVGWQSPSGRFRVTVGYLVAGWLNAVTTPGFIDAVQTNNFDAADETLIFDGLTSRLEYRF